MAGAPPKRASLQNADGYEEVAVRVKPSAAAAWDLPNGSIIEVVDEWVECDYKKHHGFIKTKNLPGVQALKAGDDVEVRDSYKGNSETCMRRHAEQDSTTGNVLCYVPNGPDMVKLTERWVEFRWKGTKGFAKARHIKEAPAAPAGRGGSGGAAASSSAPAKRGAPSDGPAEKAAPAARKGAGSASAAAKAEEEGEEEATGEPPAKVLKVEASAADDKGDAKEAEDDPMAAEAAAEEGKEAADSGAAEDVEMAGGEEPAVPGADAAPVEAAAPAAKVVEETPTPSTEAAPAKAETAAPAVAAPEPPAAAPAVEKRDCDCCFDSVSVTGGAFCPSKAHFFCGACLGNFLTAFKTADYAEQKKGKGRALCPMKDSEVAFGDAALAAFVDQDVFDEYLQIRIKVAEQGIQEQMEKENRDKIEELKAKLAEATGSAEQVELDKHRLKIIDDIFTLKCPRCKAAFLDYDNCSAISCASCACGFCSYCLEDCGKDAHKHFYDHGSKCPKEGGPLFIDHKGWQGYQNRRRSTLMRQYLATLPDSIRKKVGDLVAPDAKDLGVEMPEDYTPEALDPEAHGYLRVKLVVTRKMRAKLAEKAATLVKKGMVLNCPAAKDKIEVVSPDNPMAPVLMRKKPAFPGGKANHAASLPPRFKVALDDEWTECQFIKEKMTGWVKTKHLLGQVAAGQKTKIKDAGGHGSVLVRKEAKQEEGKNSHGFVADQTEVKVNGHWIECIWEADPTAAPAVKAGRGFVPPAFIPEDDVTLQGLKDDVWEVVKKLEDAMSVKLHATKVAIPGLKPAVAAKEGGKAAGRGRGRGRGRG